jgi:hypothetical protein
MMKHQQTITARVGQTPSTPQSNTLRPELGLAQFQIAAPYGIDTPHPTGRTLELRKQMKAVYTAVENHT